MRRHALFVGVNNYLGTDIHPLQFAVNDATGLAGFFKHCAGFDRAEVLADPRNCDVVFEYVQDMMEGLGPGDEFVFFFAGHGITTRDGHRLVCAGDELNNVKHSWAGVPLERLKLATKKSFNRLFLLDACRTDVLATHRGGACVMEKGTRDLILDGGGTFDAKGGALTILCSCDDGECAGESAKLRHGLFSKAILELLDEKYKNGGRLFLDDDFAYRQLPERMCRLAEKVGMEFNQKPQKNGPAFSLFGSDCLASSKVTTLSSSALPSTYVICPECGRHNLIAETFRCKVCGRDHLCLTHKSHKVGVCNDCAKADVKSREASVALIKAWQEERFDAVWTYWPDADQNDPEVLYVVGMAYWRDSEYARALEYLIKASALGHVEAPYEIGELYNYGFGVDEDQAEAVRWFRLAAERGSSEGMFNLAIQLEYGDNDIRNREEAVKWYLKGAERGHVECCSSLALMYEKGIGTPANRSEALKWYRKAVELGSENDDDQAAVERLSRAENFATCYKSQLAECLKAGRLKKGCSIEEVASMTRLDARVVEGLERGDFSMVSSPIYGRGFVRLCATFLGLDVNRLVDLFAAEYRSWQSSANG